MIIPNGVGPGACIGLVGISGAVAEGEDAQKNAVLEAERKLKAYGFKVKTDPICFERKGYFTGSDADRARALENMFQDPEVDAIMCFKGGWGSSRFLDMLDYDVIRNHPKMFVGFSDITSVHLALEKKCSMSTIHGPMGTTSQLQGKALKSFLYALSGKGGYEVVNTDGSEPEVLKHGQAEAELVGGNLSLLCASLGTPFELDCRGKILFIEEVHEFSYAVDRYMTHLSNAGKFRDCCGLVLGAFTQCEQETPGYGYTLRDIFMEAADKVQGPVIGGLQAGHLAQPVSLPLGREYEIRTEGRAGKLFLVR